MPAFLKKILESVFLAAVSTVLSFVSLYVAFAVVVYVYSIIGVWIIPIIVFFILSFLLYYDESVVYDNER